MDDPGVVGLVDAFEYSVEAGVAVAVREPRLLHENTSLGETALHMLVLGESQEAIRSIVGLGADVNAICFMGESPLSVAVSIGRADFARILIGAGALLDVPGLREPMLHKAVKSGNVEVVRLVLDSGASIDLQADFGEAAIHIAADDGLVEVIELLLSRGANPQLRSTFGGTALEVARRAGKEDCVELLLSRQ